MPLNQDESNERSVEQIVKEVGPLFVFPGSRLDVDIHRTIHSISTKSSLVASRKAFGMAAKTGILKNGLLLLLHLARVAEWSLVKLEGLKSAKARGITVKTFYSIVKSRTNHAHNGTSQAARLFGAASYSSEPLFADGPNVQEEWILSHNSFTPLHPCFECLPTKKFGDSFGTMNESWLGKLTQTQRAD